MRIKAFAKRFAVDISIYTKSILSEVLAYIDSTQHINKQILRVSVVIWFKVCLKYVKN